MRVARGFCADRGFCDSGYLICRVVQQERERDGARPSSRDPRDADRRDPRDRDRDEGRGRYDRREPYGGRDYRQGRDADGGYRCD